MLDAVTPHARSSDIHYLANPFLYYLRRRLGISRAFDSHASATLNRGTWFHRAFEDWLLPERERTVSMWRRIALREAELTALCAQYGMMAEATAVYTSTERRRALEAYTRLSCAFDSPHGPYAPLRDHLDKFYEPVGSGELLVTVPPAMTPIGVPGCSRMTASRTIQIDRLMRSRKTGHLWIFDLKSTTLDPSVRATRCPLEFQTKHYVFTLMGAIKLSAVPGLSSTDEVGGMCHVIVSNFDLKFGDTDRPFHWACQSTRKGVVVRAGEVRERPPVMPHLPTVYTVQTVDHTDASAAIALDVPTETGALQILQEKVGVQPKKVFQDEPSLDLYLNRIKSRYNGSGQYTHLANSLVKEPPTLLSHTFARELDTQARASYHAMLSQISDLATRDSDPALYPKTDVGLEDEGSPFLPLFLYPQSRWPEIMDTERLCVRHRD